MFTGGEDGANQRPQLQARVRPMTTGGLLRQVFQWAETGLDATQPSNGPVAVSKMGQTVGCQEAPVTGSQLTDRV